MTETKETQQTRLADDEDMPQVGEVIDGRYEVEKVIGEGGFAAVYKCQDNRTKTDVAIKVLDPMMSRRGEFSARFLREIETVSRLRHHNTIKIFDAGKTDKGCLFLVMELLNGEALDEILEEQGALSPARVKKILSQVLKSLIEAHQDGVMHRDLKPANVFIAELPGEVDYVKVLDFGIAKSRDEGADTSLTATGQVMCSPDYVAPERVRDHVCYFSSDLYSLGIMMIEMLEGELPYTGETPMMVALKHARTDRPVPIRQYTLDGPLGKVVYKSVNKDPAERFQSAQEMLEALMEADCDGVAAFDINSPEAAPSAAGKTSYLGGGATVTDLDGDLSDEDENSGSRKKAIVLIALVVLALLGVAAALVFALSDNNAPTGQDATATADEIQNGENPLLENAEGLADSAAAVQTDEPAPAEPTPEEDEGSVLPERMHVYASPEGTDIYVNDQWRATTNFTLVTRKMPEFPITLRFEKDGYKTLSRTYQSPEELNDAVLSFRLEKEPEPKTTRRSSSHRSSSRHKSAAGSSASAAKHKEPAAKPSSSGGSKKSAEEKPPKEKERSFGSKFGNVGVRLAN